MDVTPAVTNLAGQGLLGILLVLSLGAVVYLFKAVADERKNCQTVTKECEEQLRATAQRYEESLRKLYEAWIADKAATTIALERSTVSGVTLATSMEARIQTMNSLVQTIAELKQAQDASQQHFRPLGVDLIRKLDEIKERIGGRSP